jgi:hypothetical protein
MGALSTKLRNATGPIDKRIMHWCPGCDEAHGIRVEGEGRPKWTFNGNYDKPTFWPSIRCFTTQTKDDAGNTLPCPIEHTTCHYFIKEGKIEFCGDSPHALKGQTVELPDWPYAPGTYGGIDD